MELDEFGKLFLFIIGSVVFVIIGMLANQLLAPNKPNPEKLSTYECGEEPIGKSGIQFNMRFYVIALIFLIFEVEILFFFPWSTVFAAKEYIVSFPDWGIFSFVEILIFGGILILGLVYVWIKGDLDWIKPSTPSIKSSTTIPEEWYEEVNKRYSS